MLPGLERKAIELVAPHFRQADVGLRNGFDRYLEGGGIVSKRCSDVIYLDIHRTRLRGIYSSPSQKINNVGCLASIQVETIGYYQLVFFQLVSSHPAFYLCLFGVSTRNIHRERFCLLVYHCIFRFKRCTETLCNTVNHWQIVIIALHRPDGIAVFTESFAGVSAHAGIYHYRNVIKAQDKGAYIVVVMTFVVKATFGCQKVAIVADVAELGLRIPYKISGREARFLCLHQRFYPQHFESVVKVHPRAGKLGRISFIALGSHRFHGVAVYRHSVAINQRCVYLDSACRSVCKVGYPLVADIRIGDIFAHTFDLGVIEERDFSGGGH